MMAYCVKISFMLERCTQTTVTMAEHPRQFQTCPLPEAYNCFVPTVHGSGSILLSSYRFPPQFSI